MSNHTAKRVSAGDIQPTFEIDYAGNKKYKISHDRQNFET